MNTKTIQKTEKKRADRLLKRRQALLEAVRLDIQMLRKIVASGQQRKN